CESLWGKVFHIPVVPKMPQVVHGWPYHRTRDFLMVGKRCEQGKTLLCPCSLRFTRLSQSETVGDPPQGRPTGANPRTSARSRAADPRWYETCGREGKALVWRCTRAPRLRLREAYEASRRETPPRGHRAPREEGAVLCN